MLVDVIKRLLRDVTEFSQHASGLQMRLYQMDAAKAIAESVIQKRGDSFVVIFPRQSGKNELQAQIETYLLLLFSQLNGEIVKVSPTWKPQSLNAMRRLERVLSRNLLTRRRWKKESGYIYRVNNSRIVFLSGAPEANIVGATASTLLEVDEAQDVSPEKYDKDIAPMAASTNATRVFWGTAWTSQTLLARELRAARQAEQQDGRRRAFVLTAEQVGAEVPAYKKFVSDQVTRLGRNHPLVRTQFFSEEIDAQGGLFPPARRALLAGSHPSETSPAPGRIYALLIDVAGADEKPASLTSENDTNDNRDSTALTVVECDLETMGDPLIKAPSYRIIHRQQWTGIRHSTLYPILRAQVDHWQARYVVIDATGIGSGLTSFLAAAYPEKILPFTFSAQSKSLLGWNFIALIETGRLSDHADHTAEQAEFQTQLEFCTGEAGPNQSLKWSVPNGSRHPTTKQPLHDDWIMSAALCSELDRQPWTAPGETLIVQAQDPLSEMDKEGF